MKLDKDVKKIIMVVITSALFLPFIINFLYWLITIFVPWTMYSSGLDVWIGFYGGFFGASITLIGIYWQMSQDKKEKTIDMINNSNLAYKLIYNNIDLIKISLKNIEIDVDKLLKIENYIDDGKKRYQEEFEKDKQSINNELFVRLTEDDILAISKAKKNIKIKIERLSELINNKEENCFIYNSIDKSFPEEKHTLLIFKSLHRVVHSSMNELVENFDYEKDEFAISNLKNLIKKSIKNTEEDQNNLKDSKEKFNKKYNKF